MQFSIKNNETLVFARRQVALEKLLYILIDSIENPSFMLMIMNIDIQSENPLDGVFSKVSKAFLLGSFDALLNFRKNEKETVFL